MPHLSFQALRYPYFQIGHPLGISTQDSGKPQKDVQDKTGPPPYVKPAPPSQAPTKAHTLISSRPNQASQPHQHFVYPYKGEASRTEQLSHVQEGQPNPPFFPSLHNKNLPPVSVECLHARLFLHSVIFFWLQIVCEMFSLSGEGHKHLSSQYHGTVRRKARDPRSAFSFCLSVPLCISPPAVLIKHHD